LGGLEAKERPTVKNLMLFRRTLFA
jgi:hypothetical protein